MQKFTEFLFGNRFFELPFLDAMAYAVAFLLIGAMVVGLIRHFLGTSTPIEATEYREETYPIVEPYQQEWRKAA